MAGKRQDGKVALPKSPSRYYNAKKMVVHLSLMGKTKGEVRDALMSKYGYTEASANDLIRKVNDTLNEYYVNYMDDAVRHNYEKLIAVTDELYDQGKYSQLLTAIDMLNKMVGLYQEKRNIKLEVPDNFKIVVDGEQ